MQQDKIFIPNSYSLMPGFLSKSLTEQAKLLIELVD